MNTDTKGFQYPYTLNEEILREAFANADGKEDNFAMELSRLVWGRGSFYKGGISLSPFHDRVDFLGLTNRNSSSFKTNIFKITDLSPHQVNLDEIHGELAYISQHDADNPIGPVSSYIVVLIDNDVYNSEEYEAIENRLHQDKKYTYCIDGMESKEVESQWFFHFGSFTCLFAIHEKSHER